MQYVRLDKSYHAYTVPTLSWCAIMSFDISNLSVPNILCLAQLSLKLIFIYFIRLWSR